ncbi:MAG: carbonate dehydratase [Thiotrichaceae bacterium]|nr:carbonate dehydratase [Thiotrichaceae bacterium]
MEALNTLFDKNKIWAKEITETNPDFFKELAKAQSPKYLWIGCSDSRIPASQLLGLQPGEIFVHRNIANMVIHTDLNCLSVIQYAVEVVKIQHIIICGHDSCGGVKAALGKHEYGLIDNWLRHIKDVYRSHQKEIDLLQDDDDKANLLAEKNVKEQVANICNTAIIQKAWKTGQEVTVHGLMYSLETGLLKDLNISMNRLEQVQEIHQLILK